MTVPCPTCEKSLTLTPKSLATNSVSVVIPTRPAALPQALDETATGSKKWIYTYTDGYSYTPASKQPERPKRKVSPPLSKLTEATIRDKTQSGDTPLHRAAKQGRIAEIPKHLLSIELFLVRNCRDETPIHAAAGCGKLDKVPLEFLTQETLTASTEYGSSLVYTKKESKTGPTPPRTESPLHRAIRFGHADQIPKQFLTPEFLRLAATGYRETVLHYLARENRLDLISEIYADSPMWDLRNSSGQTPRGIIAAKIEREAYVARVRSELATEKQKEKLRWFGIPVKVEMTKGEASDALDKCVKDFPEKELAYYNRPATKDQMAALRAYYGKDLDEVEGPFTYGRAKNLIWEIEMKKRQKEREYENSEEGQIAEMTDFINACGVNPRKITTAEVSKAWNLAKSRNAGKSYLPGDYAIVGALSELFTDLRSLGERY